MALNMLTIAQRFCGRTNIKVPTYVIGNPDPQVLQIAGLLDEFCDDLSLRKIWQATNLEAIFTSVATESQGTLDTLCPYGYQGIVLDSFFDRTQMLPLFGGIAGAEWQARKAFNFTGPYYQFRVWQNQLWFNPVPPAGHTIAFEYNSNFFVKNEAVDGADPALYRQYWAKDTDTCLIDDALPIAWLRWAWKKEKGLEYAEDFNKYERLVNTKSARQDRPQIVNLGDRTQTIVPGIFVPAGSWNVP